jgi:hypothetical protein
MALEGTFYKSTSHGVAATDGVGGSIDTGSPLTGGLHEIFPPATSEFLGGDMYDRFQKIHWQNTGAGSITAVRAFFQDVKYTDHLKMALQQSSGDTGASFNAMPSGYATGDFQTAIGLLNAIGSKTVAPLDDFAIWVWQQIPPGLEDADAAVPLNIRIAGVTS